MQRIEGQTKKVAEALVGPWERLKDLDDDELEEFQYNPLRESNSEQREIDEQIMERRRSKEELAAISEQERKQQMPEESSHQELEPFTEEWLSSKPDTRGWKLLKKIQKIRNYIFRTLTTHTFSKLVTNHLAN